MLAMWGLFSFTERSGAKSTGGGLDIGASILPAERRDTPRDTNVKQSPQSTALDP